MTPPLTLNDAAALALARPHAGDLCDPCLGRLFARVEHDGGNAARGQSVRRALDAARPPTCSLCEGLVERIPRWADLCLEAAAGYEYDHFLVGSVLFGEIRKREEARFARLAADDASGLRDAFAARPTSPPWTPGEWLKNEINREVGRIVENRTGKRVEFGTPDLTFRLDTRFDHVELQLADLFVKGRYRKLVRDLPQTRWPCRACNGLGCRQCGGSGRTYDTSVEELVAAPLVEAAAAQAEAFHGMGREDIDARTLGRGRPFILELKRPRRRRLDWRALEQAVNAHGKNRVEVVGLAGAAPADAARYKAADPVKTYVARCRAQAPLSESKLLKVCLSLTGATLHQRTPQRVAHRRADLVRARRILALRVLEASGERFELEVRAESGTYIKEFVSGDEGRTSPSFAQAIGTPVRVEELDVTDVEWEE